MFSRLKEKFDPYIIFLEEISDNIAPSRVFDDLDKYEISFLGHEDMKALEALPERVPTETDLLRRLEEDKVCIAAKSAQEIVAFTWFDLNQCNIKNIKCSLDVNEAYLFDAYTAPSYRGMGIAPFMRNSAYQELSKLGKDRLFSFSNYSNKAAIRFKEKLEAKPLELRLAVSLRGIHLDLRLRKYRKSISGIKNFYCRISVRKRKLVDNF